MFLRSVLNGRLKQLDIARVYRISMVVIALLVGLSFFNLFFLISKQKEYAEWINISGKQRMHSERLHSVLQSILHDPSDENYEELVLILETMKRDYRYLRDSLAPLGLDEPNIYTNGYENTVLKAVYEPNDLLKRPMDQRALNNVIEHRKAIIEELNRAVEQLQRQSDRLNEIMIQRGAILLVVILIVLLIISIVIFYPLLTRLKKEHYTTARLNSELEQRVEERTRRLEELNNELESRIAERTKEIERIAVTDALTGIFNRHRFNVELEDAFALYQRYETPIALAVIDIDYFKKINDTYGHHTGDKTLVSFAALLQKQMRKTDKLARWGGEEFVILFINTELSGALIAAEGLLDAIRDFVFDEVGSVTCSIGLAELMGSDTPESFLQRADTSLYRAKEQGRNRICYQYIG